MSWATLFLAHGLKVIITDPVEGAEVTFKKSFVKAWPSIHANGTPDDVLSKNYEFFSGYQVSIT